MKRRKPLNPMIPIQDAQLQAIEGILTNTMDAFERRVRRWFSKEHSTAYLDTFKLPWDELLLHYYESNLANKSYNEVFDLAVEEYLPDFVQAAEEEDEEFAASLLEEQKATLKKAKAKAKVATGSDKATQEMAASASKVTEKLQSITKKLDNHQAKNKPTPTTMSLKFDEDPESDS